MAEYDDLGQDAFLRKCGFGPARSFILVEQGRDCDSKAIAGAALAFQAGVLRALPASEFSGGAAGAARKLRQLGFRVETRGDARPANQLTRESVQAAIHEFHQLGREAFLARHVASPAERSVVVERGEPMDAKAIIQAAWRHQHPDSPPLQANDFRGDGSSVAVPLRRLGFWSTTSIQSLKSRTRPWASRIRSPTSTQPSNSKARQIDQPTPPAGPNRNCCAAPLVSTSPGPANATCAVRSSPNGYSSPHTSRSVRNAVLTNAAICLMSGCAPASWAAMRCSSRDGLS